MVWMENPEPKRPAASPFLPAIATASTNSNRPTASRCTRPMKPVPMIAALIVLIPIRSASDPPRGTRLLANHNAVEKISCLRQSFFRRKQAVFMLDRQNMIVTKHPQRRDKLAPPLRAVTVTAGAKDPAALALFGVPLGIKHPGARQVRRKDLRVFRMNMKDRVLKHADGGDRIDTLPEKVARVEVATHVAPRDRAQPQHRLRTVNHEPRMHFDSDLHSVIGRKLRVLGPIRRNHLVPLPIQHLQIFRRPWARHPVWSRGMRRIAGTP